MNLRTADLAKINSITKYPPIPTLHALDAKGVPTDEVLVDFGGADVCVTEKIDGTNARILVSDGSFALGSREHLLTVSGDVLFDPALGIVEQLRETARRIAANVFHAERAGLAVIFGELYGGKVTGGSKNYTANREAYGWRVFDYLFLPEAKLSELEDLDGAALARRRESAHDFWFSPTDIAAQLVLDGLDGLAVPPVEAGAPPADRRLVLEWLADVMPRSRATLDATAAARPEGVVVRTADRSRVAKVRFDDYRKVSRG